jgi:ferredoxin
VKIKRKIIEIDEALCDGCGNCVTACDEGAIQIINGKAKVISDIFCDGLGACIGDCPPDALKIVEREAEAFDEEAVQQHLAGMEHQTVSAPEPSACGCPSEKIQTFIPTSACQTANQPKSLEQSASALSNWPIQINLIQPQAPFLKGCDLLLAADCVPAAYPNFHQDFLKGKTLMLGCPKLDDAEAYVEKFAAIFKTADIKSVTIVIMEVPCCSGLPVIVKKALEISGVKIALEEIVVSIREGKVLERNWNPPELLTPLTASPA